MTDPPVTRASDTAPLPYAPAAAATPAALDRELPGTRAWFVGYVLWMSALAVLALWQLDRFDHGVPQALRGWLLALLAFYLSLCNVFLPLPTAWIILLAAAPGYALVENGPLRVAIVAAVSTAGTVMANLNEYHLLAWLLRFGWGRRVRNTRVYGWAARWFDRAPFQLLALIGFIPIPVDAVRWLAILQRYPRPRFAAAYALGRGLRYAVFAGCAVLLELTGTQVVLIQLGLVAVGVVGRLGWALVRRVWNPRAGG